MSGKAGKAVTPEATAVTAAGPKRGVFQPPSGRPAPFVTKRKKIRRNMHVAAADLLFESHAD